MRSNVVLPAPFGPKRPTISARSTSKETSSSAGRPSPRWRAPPYSLVTPLTLINSEPSPSPSPAVAGEGSSVSQKVTPDRDRARASWEVPRTRLGLAPVPSDPIDRAVSEHAAAARAREAGDHRRARAHARRGPALFQRREGGGP